MAKNTVGGGSRCLQAEFCDEVLVSSGTGTRIHLAGGGPERCIEVREHTLWVRNGALEPVQAARRRNQAVLAQNPAQAAGIIGKVHLKTSLWWPVELGRRGGRPQACGLDSLSSVRKE